MPVLKQFGNERGNFSIPTVFHTLHTHRISGADTALEPDPHTESAPLDIIEHVAVPGERLAVLLFQEPDHVAPFGREIPVTFLPVPFLIPDAKPIRIVLDGHLFAQVLHDPNKHGAKNKPVGQPSDRLRNVPLLGFTQK